MLKHLHTFTGHQNPVYTLTFSDKADIFYSAGNDKGVVEWSLKKMAFIMVKMPVQRSVYALHNYNNQLFIGEQSGAFSVFDFDKQKLLAKINAHPKPIFDIKTIIRKNELLVASEDGMVSVWSLADFKELHRFYVCPSTVRTIALSPNQTEISLGCKDHRIYIYNSADYSPKQVLSAHTFPITSLAYHPEGKYMLSGGRDAQIRVWDSHYQLQKTISAHMFTVYDIQFHPSLPYFATCSQDKSIKLWDSKTFKLKKIQSLEKTGLGHSHSVNKLAWSHDGNFLISTGDDKKIMVWKMEL